MGLETVEKVSLQVKCPKSIVFMCPRKSIVEHRSAHRYLFASYLCNKCKSCVGKIDINGRIA